LATRLVPEREDRRTEEDLLRGYRDGDVRARQQLIERLMPLARRIASRYAHTGESREDLDQVAFLALTKAVDRYDPDIGPFRAYAVPYMLGELRRHFRDKGWGMHVPRSVQERLMKINQAMERLLAELGRPPTPKELAQHTGEAVEDVLEALDAAGAYSPASLDAPFPGAEDGEARTVGDGIGREDGHFELVELGASVGPVFRALPEREQMIVKLRFVDDLKQHEIAERIGISQMHVSRLLRRAVERLTEAAIKA
jgi:RNA polymerase sigma-B factor